LQSDVKKVEAKLPVNENLDLEFSATPASRSEVSDSMLPESESPALEIKGSMFTLPVLRLQSTDMKRIARDLSQRLAQHLLFFEHAPVVIELDHLDDKANTLDLSALCILLRQAHLIPVGVRQANPEQAQSAIEAGLAVLKGGSSATPRNEPAVPSSQSKPITVPSNETDSASHRPEVHPAKVVRQPVRSGQQIYARGGDLIVLAAVNAGAEVIADGNIHVYASLRGRALAGVQGDTSASIFTQSMEAELVAIAGHYQVFEDGPAKDIYASAARIFLDDTHIKVSPLAQ
jgi:septum site-determining protein MinC